MYAGSVFFGTPCRYIRVSTGLRNTKECQCHIDTAKCTITVCFIQKESSEHLFELLLEKLWDLEI